MYASQIKTESSEHRQALAEFIREETDGGREIMRFYLDVMRNRFEDAKLCHRIAAAREIAKHGSKEARDFLNAVARSKNGRTPSRAPARLRPIDGLADFIRKETDDGKEVARFLLDIIRNRVEDARMGHKISAARELLKRAFDNVRGHSDDEYDGRKDAKNCKNKSCYHWQYAVKRWGIDSYGRKHLEKIYGGEEAASVAIRAAIQHRRDTVRDHYHVPDHDFTPIKNPEDDPYGKGSYRYDELCIHFGDNQAIRIANKAVEEYKKQLAADLETKEQHSDEDPPEDRRHQSGSRQDHSAETPAKPTLLEGEGWSLPRARCGGEGESQVESRPLKPAIAVDSEVTQKSPAAEDSKPAQHQDPSDPVITSENQQRSDEDPPEDRRHHPGSRQKHPAAEDAKLGEPPDPTDSVILSEAERSPAPGPERPRRSGRLKKRRLKRRLLAASRSRPVPSLAATTSDRGPPTAPSP